MIIEIDKVLKDLKFMEKIGWYCDKREEYEIIREENKFTRFEIMDI